MSDLAIRAEGLSKLYPIGRREPYYTLRDTLVRSFTAPFQRLRDHRQSHPDAYSMAHDSQSVWALKDVSFEVKQGEVVGIIGRNGAGKSTLLKILSRITEPTEGQAEVKGRVGSLLEVGTGFHPELTGRENIYLNGAILGMKKSEIERSFDEIVAFAEIEQFLDTPVKYYSSGMYMRLAFSVAAHLEPEILLVDEVLAVGDAAFQKKCLGKMGDAVKDGRTILFVSHNVGAIRSLCTRGIFLQSGRLDCQDEINTSISRYFETVIANDPRNALFQERECPYVRITGVAMRDERGNTTSRFHSDDTFKVVVNYEVLRSTPEFSIWVRVCTLDGVDVFSTSDSLGVRDTFNCSKQRQPGYYQSICLIPASFLNVGKYMLNVGLGNQDIPTDPVFTFEIVEAGEFFETYAYQYRGIIRRNFDWVISHRER